MHLCELLAQCSGSPSIHIRFGRLVYAPQDEDHLYLVMEYLPGGDVMVSVWLCLCFTLFHNWLAAMCTIKLAMLSEYC